MVAALAVMLGGCNKYDDSELRTEINNLKARLDAVESLNNYKDLLAKLDKGKTVTGVSENNGVYTLTFDDNSTITFNQKGEKGAPGESIIGPEGKPGISPQIKNEDGKWWISTDNGQTWEEAGSSVGTPGEPGAPGENGISPRSQERRWQMVDFYRQRPDLGRGRQQRGHSRRTRCSRYSR